MSEKKSDTEDLDAGWDVEEAPSESSAEELAPETRAVESIELLHEAGMSRAASRPFLQAISPSSAPPPAAEALPRPDMCATVPPPVPASEYVATMMGQAPESDVRRSGDTPMRAPGLPSLADRHRAILRTLHEEDPLRFDFDDEAELRPVVSEAPSIETTEVGAEELDPDLLKDTPVPPKPPIDSRLDELDELPVDEVLFAVSQKPLAAARATATQRSRGVATPVSVGTPHTPSPRSSPPPPRAAGMATYDLSMDEDVATPKPAIISDLPFDPMPPPLRIPNIPSFALQGEPEGGGQDRATLPPYDPSDPIDKVHERFVLGDYSGALVLAEGVLEERPEHPDALKYADSCRDMLRQMYLARLGSGKQVVQVLMRGDQLRWLTLDHRAGFLLSCIDGTSSIDEILDVSGMPPLDALRILYELVQEGVIRVDPREPAQ